MSSSGMLYYIIYLSMHVVCINPNLKSKSIARPSAVNVKM